jgi:allophanate hydrolase
LAAEIQARSGVSMGATGRAVPPPAAAPAAPSSGRTALAVVGAHLAGLPLNPELVSLGATFLREAETTGDYRLFALPGSKPPKPGLLRVAEGEGASIRLELWTLDREGFGAFVAGIPAPLGIGTVRLSDGSSAKGFLVEAEAVKGAEDITSFGGWRAYLSAR